VPKIAFRSLQIWKFSGGGYPQCPLQGSCFRHCDVPPSAKNLATALEICLSSSSLSNPYRLLYLLCYLHLLLVFWADSYLSLNFGGSSHCLNFAGQISCHHHSSLWIWLVSLFRVGIINIRPMPCYRRVSNFKNQKSSARKWIQYWIHNALLQFASRLFICGQYQT